MKIFENIKYSLGITNSYTWWRQRGGKQLLYLCQRSLSFILFFWSALLRYNLHKIKFTNFKCTIQCVLTNATTTKIMIQNISIIPGSSLVVLGSQSFPSNFWPLATTYLFFITVVLPFSEFYINGTI